jgi:hypothetical protein
MLPEIIGEWPPATSTYGHNRELHNASMLMLFMPWRDIRHLKNGHAHFYLAFDEFEKSATEEVRYRIENLQAFYKCK